MAAEAPKGTARRDQLLSLEQKAQAKWEKANAFEVDAPEGAWDAGKFLATFPYPYMNGLLHIGHGFSLTKAEFVGFVKRATDKSSPEYRELYFFLLKTFQAGDVMRTGEVDAVTFDRMIEDAADAPRRHGLAPKSSAMFATDAVRHKNSRPG